MGIPFKRPDPFPQNSLLSARVATYGSTQHWGETFSKLVFRAQFGEGRNIDDKDLIRELVAEAGGEPESALREANLEVTKSALRHATAEAMRLGLFGSPSFVTPDNELFWGNDRLEQALNWARDRAGGA